MFSKVLKNSVKILGKKPFLLIGLSLLNTLMCVIAVILCGPVLGLSLAACMVLAIGMAGVFVNGYKGNEISSENLFSGFGKFGRNAGGMGWRYLWVVIWSLIPIVGPVFAVIKGYAYSFVPYILNDDDKISATSALKKSMELTNGHKVKLFLVDVFYSLAWLIIPGICCGFFMLGSWLCSVHFLLIIFGVIFIILAVAIILVFVILVPFFKKLVLAGLYNEIKAEKENAPAKAIEA